MLNTLFIIGLLCLSAQVSLSATKPNVLLILTDDQGYGDLSCHGNPVLKTPVLDRLASDSIKFDRFFVSPLCAPTRSSLLTGRYSLRTGVKGVSNNEETMRSQEVTLAEVLKSVGYRTGLFGKWHNGDNAPNNPESQGFDHAWGYNRGHWNNYFDTMVKRNGVPVKAPGFIVDATTDEVLSFMDSVPAEQPFFAWVAYTTPHSPFQCPDKYFDEYKSKGLDDELACVYGMCANLDENIGRLLSRLEEKKMREDTIVIFLTDNGPNTQRYNDDMKGKKGGFDEGGSRVPFFLRWPARFKEARKVSQIAMHIDVLPTLMELCDVRALTLPLDGRSLVPLLEGKADSWPERTLFTQFNLGARGSLQAKAKAKAKTGAAAVRTQRYRAVKGAQWELYDMQADPSQTTDLAGKEPAVLAALVKEYDAWRASVALDADKPNDVPHLGGQENPVELTAPNAVLTGGINFGGKAPNNAWLVGWDSTEPTVTWRVAVQKAGKYHARLQYLCSDANAGSTMQVSLGSHAVSAKVLGTPIVQIPSPDRASRKSEVLEHVWHWLDLGSFDLQPGEQQIQVRCSELKGQEALWLKGIELKRE
jgi:arylsulfatase A-like enzyme